MNRNEQMRKINEEAAYDFLNEQNPHYAEEAGPEVFHWMAEFASSPAVKKLIRDEFIAEVEAEIGGDAVGSGFISILRFEAQKLEGRDGR